MEKNNPILLKGRSGLSQAQVDIYRAKRNRLNPPEKGAARVPIAPKVIQRRKKQPTIEQPEPSPYYRLSELQQSEAAKANRICFFVYSEDRPCQLDLLLRSIEKYVFGWDYHIVAFYSASNSRFIAGYEKTMKYHPHCQFESLHTNKSIFEYINDDYIIHLLGSHVFKDYFHQTCDEVCRFSTDDDAFCLSLDLSLQILEENPPNAIEWSWSNFQGKWGNPLGFGKIYPVKRVSTTLQNQPNQIYNGWSEDLTNSPKKMMCLPESKLINLIDANNVNTRYLNDIFLLGKKLNLIHVSNNVHTNIPMDLACYQ